MEREPPELDTPPLQHPTAIASFHSAGVTSVARRNFGTMGSVLFVRFLRGEKPPRLVNQEVWERVRARYAERAGKP